MYACELGYRVITGGKGGGGVASRCIQKLLTEGKRVDERGENHLLNICVLDLQASCSLSFKPYNNLSDSSYIFPFYRKKKLRSWEVNKLSVFNPAQEVVKLGTVHSTL